MTPPTTLARQHVAAALTGLGVPVHPEPPETVAGVCIVLVPGEPWAVRRGLAGSWTVVVDVVILVPIQGGRTMLARLESLAHAAAAVPALRRPVGVPDLPQVQRQQWGQGEYLAATIPTVVHIREEEE